LHEKSFSNILVGTQYAADNLGSVWHISCYKNVHSACNL